MQMGRYDEALAEISRAQQLDPSSTPILADKGLILFQEGKLEEATSLLQQVEASQPGFLSTHRYLAYVYEQKRDFPDYLEEVMKAANLSQNESELAIAHANVDGFKAGGEQGMLKRVLQTDLDLFSQGKVPAFTVAGTYARLGEQDETLRYLQISYQRHEPSFLVVRGDRTFAPYRDKPAVRKLIEQAGLSPEK